MAQSHAEFRGDLDTLSPGAIRAELRRDPRGGTVVSISPSVTDRRVTEAIEGFVETMNALAVEIAPDHSGSSGEVVVLVWNRRSKGPEDLPGANGGSPSAWQGTQLGPGIEATPGICGGEPRIAGTRIPVWALEQSRRLGMSEADILRAYPSLRAADVINAWTYAAAHRDEIDDQIREHEEA
jgi:uncharacterized protein (DUF433 family)